MPKYRIPVWKMCREVAGELPAIFAPTDVVRKIHEKYPQVKESTIRAHVIALSPNHPSYKHYGGRHQVFYYLGNGRYRSLRPEEGGELIGKRLPSKNIEAILEEWKKQDPYLLDVEGFERFLDEQLEPERILGAEEVEEEALRFSFEFEADLEHHLVNNLEDIEGGLKLYVEGEKTGEQYVTDVGRIDILAVDKNGDFVVIELKGGQANDKSFAQLSRYMGWVQKHLAKGRRVRGIIIARKVTDELKYAASISESVKVKEYDVHFSFHDIDLT